MYKYLTLQKKITFSNAYIINNIFFLYRLKNLPEPIQTDKNPPCDNSNKVRSSLPSPSRIISSAGRTAKITEVIIDSDSDSDDSFEEPISANANSNSLTDSTIVRTPFRLFNPHTQGNLLRGIDNKTVKDKAKFVYVSVF